jgi:hypothetical protein
MVCATSREAQTSWNGVPVLFDLHRHQAPLCSKGPLARLNPWHDP